MDNDDVVVHYMQKAIDDKKNGIETVKPEGCYIEFPFSIIKNNDTPEEEVNEYIAYIPVEMSV